MRSTCPRIPDRGDDEGLTGRCGERPDDPVLSPVGPDLLVERRAEGVTGPVMIVPLPVRQIPRQVAPQRHQTIDGRLGVGHATQPVEPANPGGTVEHVAGTLRDERHDRAHDEAERIVVGGHRAPGADRARCSSRPAAGRCIPAGATPAAPAATRRRSAIDRGRGAWSRGSHRWRGRALPRGAIVPPRRRGGNGHLRL